MQSSELGAARFGGNPDDLAGGLSRGVAGEALWVAETWFGCSLAAGTAPMGMPGGGRGCSESGRERGGASQLAPVSALGRPREEVHDFG
jgi:hypothetical protein